MDIQNKLQRVTPELLSEFLYKRGVKVFRCLLCGSEDCRIPQTTINRGMPNEATFVDAIKADENFQSLDAITNYQYRFICMGCGYVHFISALPIKDWLDEEERREGGYR